MLLKRVYDTSGPEPRLTGVKLLRHGPIQRFSPRIVQRGIAEGWLGMGDNKIVLRTDPPATYKIIRMPGHYCCFCSKALDDSPSGKVHVETQHAGVKSPDPSNPAGYRRDNFYECALVETVTGKLRGMLGREVK